ncbi:MAG: hypothetical protein M1825_001394 [Sarcosagium campestre]|nr:MAG: hypothetical protein M1825_001394 [Sarcosagium campestre]
MPTNRSFFANFLAAFRAHSALQQASSTAASSSTSSQAATATSAAATSSFSPSNARAISTKAGNGSGPTTAAVQAAGHLQSARQPSTSPLPRSPRSPAGSPGNHIGGGSSRRRRSSSSSTEGFRDALGTEKWYIGGRSAAGEERYYRLGMARRHRSIDRLSLDRVSL